MNVHLQGLQKFAEYRNQVVQSTGQTGLKKYASQKAALVAFIKESQDMEKAALLDAVRKGGGAVLGGLYRGARGGLGAVEGLMTPRAMAPGGKGNISRFQAMKEGFMTGANPGDAYMNVGGQRVRRKSGFAGGQMPNKPMPASVHQAGASVAGFSPRVAAAAGQGNMRRAGQLAAQGG